VVNGLDKFPRDAFSLTWGKIFNVVLNKLSKKGKNSKFFLGNYLKNN